MATFRVSVDLRTDPDPREADWSPEVSRKLSELVEQAVYVAALDIEEMREVLVHVDPAERTSSLHSHHSTSDQSCRGCLRLSDDEIF